MELNGFVQNGVIVLTGGASLPEGTPVTVSCGVDATTPPPVGERKHVVFPLVDSDSPGTLHLTNAMIGEIFDEEEASASRRVMEEPAYDDLPWTDEERDAIRSEALDELGWEGMEAYQVPDNSTVSRGSGESVA